MNRLSPTNHPSNVALPAYDRATKRIGIIHFGLGAFTRAHQAWYTDSAMAVAGGDWMTVGVSLRAPDVAAQLNPQCGLYTLAVRSGGLEVAARFEGVIDLLLTDTVMPKMNGKELMTELKKKRSGIKTIFISGYAQELLSEEGKLDPGINLVQKPFSMEFLMQELRRVLDN